MSDFDLHLISEGSHDRIYEKLGAHPIWHDGASGTHFAAWEQPEPFVNDLRAAFKSLR